MNVNHNGRKVSQPEEVNTTYETRDNVFSNTPLEFLMNEFINSTFLTSALMGTIRVLKKIGTKNKLWQLFLNTLEVLVVPFIMIVGLYFKYKRWQEERNRNDKTPHDLQMETIYKVLETEEINSSGLEFSVNVIEWLMTNPDTKHFQIKHYYNDMELDTPVTSSKIKQEFFQVLISFKGKLAILLFKLNEYNNKVFVRYAQIIHPDNIRLEEYTDVINADFITSLDTVNNVIVFNDGITFVPRRTMSHNMNQINLCEFTAEIRTILKKEQKKGYVLAGPPGTGKSSVLKYLESNIKEYPIVKFTADANNYNSESSILEQFKLIKLVQPCIVFMEDMDSFGFEDKSSTLGTFLNEIDAINDDLKCVFVSTVNETGLIHYSLINRPGRFDEIKLIGPPTTESEVLEVINTAISEEKRVDKQLYSELKFDLNEFWDSYDWVKTILKHKFTHADIREIIKKAFLLDNTLSNNNIIKAVDVLINSKKVLVQCLKPHDLMTVEDDE